MSMAKNWIKGAIKHPGALTSKAKSAHMSVAKFTSKALGPKSKASSATKRQASLAKTLKKLGK